MISWARRRKFIYSGSFFILSLVVAGLFFFNLKDKPTCFDGKKNQNELNIDCGGGCQAVCKEEVSDLVTLWSRVFRVSEGKYDAVALVENPNFSFGLRELPYTLKVYDNSNILITENRGKTFVNPSEKFLIFLSNIETGRRLPAKAFIEFGDSNWSRVRAKEASSKAKFSIEEKDFKQDPLPRLSALIINNGSSALKNISLQATLADQEGNAFAASSSFISELEAFGRKDIRFTWPEAFSQKPFVTDIYVRINFFK